METENFEFIRSKFKDVLANSSVHGIDKFIENEKKFLRFLWIVVLLTSFSVSVYIIATNIKEYKEYRTKVSVNIIRDMHAELPAVTICNANPFNNKIETLQYIVNMFVERNELFILDFLGLRSLVNSTKENEKLDTTSMEESSEVNISSVKTTTDPILFTEIHSTLNTGTTTEEGALNINDLTTITKSETPKAPSTLNSIPDTSPTISTAYTAVKTEISSIFDAITTVPIEPLSVTTDNSTEVDKTTSNTTGTIIEAPLTLSKIITTTSPSNVTLYTQLLNNLINEINEIKYSTSINETSTTVENNLIFTIENYFENTTEAGPYIEHSQSNTNSTYVATTQYPQITFLSDIPTPSEQTVIINYTIKATSTSYNEITTGLLEMASTKDMSSTAQNTNQPVTSIGSVQINDTTRSTQIIQPTSTLLISQITDISSENPTEATSILTDPDTINDTNVTTQTISLSTDTSKTTMTLPLTNPIQTEEGALNINDDITTITKSETLKARSTLNSIPDTSPTISTAYTAVKTEISTIFDAITTIPTESLSATTDNSTEVDITTSLYRNLLNTTGTIIETPLTLSNIITTTSPSNVTLYTQLLNNYTSINQTLATIENNLIFTVENYFENTTEAGPYIEHSQSNTNSTYVATTQYPQITFLSDIPTPSEQTVIINYTIKATSTSYNEITTGLLEMASTKDMSSTAQNTNQPVTSIGVVVINDSTTSTKIIQPTSSLLISQITDISSENPTEATIILTETETISDTSVTTQTISLSTDTSTTTTTTLPLTNPIQTTLYDISETDDTTSTTQLKILSATSIEMATTTENNILITSFSSTTNSTEILLTNTIETTLFEMIETSDTALATLTNVQNFVTSIGLNERVDTTSTAHYELPLITSTEMTTRVGNSEIIADLLPTEATEISMTNPFETTGNTENLTNFSEYILTYEPNGSFLTSANLAAQDSTKNPKTAIYLNNTISPDEYSTQSTTNSPPNVTAVNNTNLATTVSKTQTNNSTSITTTLKTDSSKSKTSTKPTSRSSKSDKSLKVIDRNNNIVQTIYSIFQTNNLNTILSEILDSIRAYVVSDKNLDNGRRYFLGQYIEDFILSFSFNNQNINNLKENNTHFWNYQYGNCYTMHPGKLKPTFVNGDTVDYIFEIFAGNASDVGKYLDSNGIHVFVHDKNTDSILLDDGTNIPTGVCGQIDVMKKVRNNLKNPYSECIDSLSTFENSNRRIYNYMSDLKLTVYNQPLCFKLCFQDKLFDKCGCLDYRKPLINNASFCVDFNQLDCMKRFENHFTTTNLNDLCTPVCPKQCHTTTYSINKHLSNYPTSTYAKYLKDILPKNVPDEPNNLKKYLEKSVLKLIVRYKHSSYESFDDVPCITINQLLGNTGGYLGLFLGISILSILELANYLIYLIIAFIRR